MKRYGWDFSARLPGQSDVPAHFFRDPEGGLAAVDRELDTYRRSHEFDVHLLETKQREKLTYEQVAERCGVWQNTAKERIRREIGRAAGRAIVCQKVYMWGGRGAEKKTKTRRDS